MRKNRMSAVVIAAGLIVGTAAIAQPAVAATPDCSGYEYVATLHVNEGKTSIPWQYVVSLEQGTVEVCLDGPDGSDYGLTLQRFVPGGTQTVATAAAGTSDKTLSYEGPISGYRIQVSADIAGSYTVGVNVPG
ncbi:hypothetical protein QFZ75_001026 [Streptomyces sp. V3I8]|jgi:streptogrisin C|uniref:hypothetical protein n=1 Tax=Streptomyces sp. V3I8 TaxID=3042279 RepID=UPI002783C188|nr:hypothetical protein [Streptomyces sp. V3I8]MDQ1034610.1 hypothetical protein [Streptomyces sp. V3I8]